MPTGIDNAEANDLYECFVKKPMYPDIEEMSLPLFKKIAKAAKEIFAEVSLDQIVLCGVKGLSVCINWFSLVCFYALIFFPRHQSHASLSVIQGGFSSPRRGVSALECPRKISRLSRNFYRKIVFSCSKRYPLSCFIAPCRGT